MKFVKRALTLILPFLFALSSSAALIWETPSAPEWESEWGKAANENFTVLWWNLGMGEPNRLLMQTTPANPRNPDEHFSPLDHNLKQLMRSPQRPDVMIFGEYQLFVFEHRTANLLSHYYPHFAAFQYTDRLTSQLRWIVVYSSVPIESQSRSSLTWHPPKATPSDIEGDEFYWGTLKGFDLTRFDRKYNRVTVTLGGRKIAIVPAHLINPWRGVLNSLNTGPGKEPSTWDFISDAASLVSAERENPLYNQALSLRDRISGDLGEDFARSDFLLVGDFNIPNSVLSFEPNIHSVLGSGLREAKKEGADYTFPAPSSMFGSLNSHHKIIDHAWVGSKLKGARSWSLQIVGSDHFPIQVVLPLIREPNKKTKGSRK